MLWLENWNVSYHREFLVIYLISYVQFIIPLLTCSCNITGVASLFYWLGHWIYNSVIMNHEFNSSPHTVGQ